VQIDPRVVIGWAPAGLAALDRRIPS